MEQDDILLLIPFLLIDPITLTNQQGYGNAKAFWVLENYFMV